MSARAQDPAVVAAARLVAIVRDMLATPSTASMAYVLRHRDAYREQWRHHPSYAYTEAHVVRLIDEAYSVPAAQNSTAQAMS